MYSQEEIFLLRTLKSVSLRIMTLSWRHAKLCVIARHLLYRAYVTTRLDCEIRHHYTIHYTATALLGLYLNRHYDTARNTGESRHCTRIQTKRCYKAVYQSRLPPNGNLVHAPRSKAFYLIDLDGYFSHMFSLPLFTYNEYGNGKRG